MITSVIKIILEVTFFVLFFAFFIKYIEKKSWPLRFKFSLVLFLLSGLPVFVTLILATIGLISYGDPGSGIGLVILYPFALGFLGYIIGIVADLFVKK